MQDVTLVIMAAGIGSRFGGGIKQLTPVGPNGEFIIDYSIYDAVQAGFTKVVFIIKKELEKEFKETIGNRIPGKVKVEYVFQELSDIPEKYEEKLFGRIRPWGTGQAILACKDCVREPFLVINADDYYGKKAYKVAYTYLTEEKRCEKDKMSFGMVRFILQNTMSEHGTVTRGVCKVDEDNMLTEVEETYEIQRKGNVATGIQKGRKVQLSLNSAVSMNMWGLKPGIFEVLEEGFVKFLENIDKEDNKTEYLLPQIIGELLKENKVSVKVLESPDKWFGVTYKEDKDKVINCIAELIDAGVYPDKLVVD